MPGGLREAAQRATREHAAAAGIAALHEAGGPDINGADDFVALIALAPPTAGPDLVAYWGQPGGPRAAIDLGAAGAAGDLFVDGALGSHTAWLREPYADEPGRLRQPVPRAGRVTEHLVACTRAGVQAGFHAIGDAAIDVVVEGCARPSTRAAMRRVRAARHRLEHLRWPARSIARCWPTPGVVASVQPLFDAHWGAPGGAYESRLGASGRSPCTTSPGWSAPACPWPWAPTAP